MLSFIRNFHKGTVVPAVKAFVSDSETRTRFVGGAAITSLVLVGLQLGLTIAFLWSHDIYDSDFATNHFLASVATLTFVVGLAFIALPLLALRAAGHLADFATKISCRLTRKVSGELETTTVGANRIGQFLLRALDASPQYIFGGYSAVFRLLSIAIIGVVLFKIIQGTVADDTAVIAVGLVALLVALIVGIRWYVSDPVASNYLTGLSGIVALALIGAFPYHAAAMYQQLALRPFGLSGVRVSIETENSSKPGCLVLLGQAAVWVREDVSLIAVPRERATVRFDLNASRTDRQCSTIRVFGLKTTGLPSNLLRVVGER
jgi:hypothetical protein